MNFTASTIAQSLSDYLAPALPGVAFYQGPIPQDAQPPCVFLQQSAARVRPGQGGRQLRQFSLDLAYMLDPALPDLQRLYQQAAETLDEVMETFPYTDGQSTTLLHTYDREWEIDQNVMHYRFGLQVWVARPQTVVTMETMDYIPEVISPNA